MSREIHPLKERLKNALQKLFLIIAYLIGIIILIQSPVLGVVFLGLTLLLNPKVAVYASKIGPLEQLSQQPKIIYGASLAVFVLFGATRPSPPDPQIAALAEQFAISESIVSDCSSSLAEGQDLKDLVSDMVSLAEGLQVDQNCAAVEAAVASGGFETYGDALVATGAGFSSQTDYLAHLRLEEEAAARRVAELATIKAKMLAEGYAIIRANDDRFDYSSRPLETSCDEVFERIKRLDVIGSDGNTLQYQQFVYSGNKPLKVMFGYQSYYKFEQFFGFKGDNILDESVSKYRFLSDGPDAGLVSSGYDRMGSWDYSYDKLDQGLVRSKYVRNEKHILGSGVQDVVDAVCIY